MARKVALAYPDDSDEKQGRQRGQPISDTPELDARAESVCQWAAGRAAAIVVLPVVGILWLTGNIMYMVTRIAGIYGAELSRAAIKGFISAMVGNVALLFLASNVPGLNVVIATGVTYALGKVAQAWIKDGMPSDVTKYKEEYERRRHGQ